MAISDQQKLDFLFKKLGFGATKTDTNALKAAVNEEIPSPLLLSGNNLWTDAAAIPSTKPSLSSDIVECYQDAGGGSNTVQTSMLGTASTNRSWTTGLTDWIPPQFGASYQIKVYIDNAGAANPESTGTQLFAAGSGNNDEWFFDYQSGILNFIGTNLPSGIGSKRIFIAGARYVGKLGNRFTTLFVDSGVYEHTTVDSTDITMADIITAYIDSADIMHAIIDSADITLGRISTVQATNLTADSAHIKALSADSLSLSELTANIITTNQIQGPANLVIDPAAVGDATGLVQILGNLQVEGTTTTINSTTVSLNDKNLVLADSSVNAAAADGAGITVKLDQSGNVATLLYKSTEDKWEVNKNFHVPNLNADSADISLLRSDSAVIINADITNLDADSARIKIFQFDSGNIGKINSIDSARAERFHIDRGTGRKLDIDSASFGTLSASQFRMSTTPNRFLVADANNVVGTSVNFIGNNARVDFYNAAVQIQNTGTIDVASAVNVGTGTTLTSQIVTTNNLHTARIKVSSIPAKRIPITLANDSIGSTDDLFFGSHTGMFQTHDGVGVGFNSLQDSGNYRFTVDKSSGKITNTGGFKIGRHNNIPTGQFIFSRPFQLNTSQQSEDNMLPDHNRDFYGLELSIDSGQLISTASRNEFRSPILQSVSSAPERRLLDVKGLGDSNLFTVFADGSLDFFGQLRRKGSVFAGGGIFEKDSNTQNAFFFPKDDATIQARNQYGFGFVAMNQKEHEQGTFISKLQHSVPSTHQQYSNVIQRQKYNLSVDGTFAIRGDVDSSGVDYVISPGAVYDWTNPDTNQTNKVNYADDSDKSRLLYIPSKAIVRAGLLQDSSMRGSTMGMFSTGTGYRPIAQGIGSIAMGIGAAARSNYSISMGYHNDVSSTLNIHTVAIGSQNKADASAASTQKTTLIGHDNHMRGNNAVIIGVGNNTTPNTYADGSTIDVGAGDNTVVIGTLNKIGLRGTSAASNGAASVVIGRQNELGPTTAMYAIGAQNRLTVRAAGSYVFGAGAYMDAGQTLALGLNHKVTAPNATAIGTRAQVDSSADFSIVIGLDDATGQSTNDPNLMSVQGGNVSIGSGLDKFTDAQYSATGNLYISGSLIVAGSILEETSPGVTSSSTPFTDDGRDVSSNLSGTPRRFGFNDVSPYQSAVFKGQEGFQYSANLLTPGAAGQNGYTINPYPFVDDDDDPSTPDVPTGEVDSALYDSNATENSMISYIGKTGTLKIGTFSGGAIYDTYLRPGRVGFQSISLGKNNINAGLRTTVIGQGNDIQRGGGPKKVLGTNIPLNPGDSLNVASLRASDMIVIGDENVYDSAATGKKVMVLGHNNIIKGSAENKIVIGGFAKPINNSVLSGGTMYDREIIMKYADSIGQDSLNNTHIAIGKNKVSGNYTVDMRGDLHLDEGSRIMIGDGSSLRELPLSLFNPIVPQTSDPTRRTTQQAFEAGIGGSVASITTDGNNRIVVTTSGNHNLPTAGTDSTVGVSFSNVPTSTNGITGIIGAGLHLIPHRIDATSFFLLEDSYRSGIFVRSGVQATDEDGDNFTITKVGSGATSGTVQRMHHARPIRLGEPLSVAGDFTATGRGALFRVDSLGVGFTADGTGGVLGTEGNDDRRHYNFTAGPQGGLEISKDVSGSFATFPIKINGTPLDTYLDNTLTFAKLADITTIVDAAYVQARVTTDEFWVNDADALYYRPGLTTKPVQIGLDETETTSSEKSTYALHIKTKSGNGVINIKDPSNSINADTTSPIQINGANWPTDNYIKNIVDGTYIQSQVSVSNSTITNAIDETYLSTIIDSDYVRARVKDSDEFQTSADGKSVFIAHTPNTFDVKLGIGTATPTAKLEVTGHIKGDSATFEGPTLIQGHTLNPKDLQFVYTVNGTQSIAGEVFLNNDVTNINANTTVLNAAGIKARIAAAGTSDSDFTVDLGGSPDPRFFLIYKIKSNGDSVDLPEGAGIPANDVIPRHGGGTGHTINSNAWRFDPANDRFLKIKKFVFESDGSGNIIDQAFHFRDRRLQTTISLTSLDDTAPPNVLQVNKNFATIQRLRSGSIIDSDVAGASVAADGFTINIASQTADLNHALGDSIRVGDVFKITDFENRQISGLTVHGPTIFTSGGAADSAENKSGLVTFQDSALFNGKVVFTDSASFVKDITIPADKQILIPGLMVFDSDIAATTAIDENGDPVEGQGGALATTIISHPRAPQNRFQMFREVRNPGTQAVIERKLMSFDSNVMAIVDSNLVGSRLNTNTQWNFATDARQVSSLFYQGDGGVIIGGNQSSIQYSKGGGLISDSDTKLQLNQGNAIFKQDTWDGIGGSTTFDVVPPIGEGSRFMWIPQRASLRAGAIEAGSGKAAGGRTMSATAWDDLFIGQASTALGANADAKNYSVAIGYKVQAGELTYTGNDAIGFTTQYNHEENVAIGVNVDNRAKKSVAIGIDIEHRYSPTTPASRQVSIGEDIINANKSDTVAIGSALRAFSGVAIGSEVNTTSYANANLKATAIGHDLSANGDAVVIGKDISGSVGSVIVGRSGNSGSIGAVAVGVNADAGQNGVAIGSSTSASTNGTSIGKSNNTGNSGVSVGRDNSSGQSTAAIGINNSVSSYGSSAAIGINNSSGGNGSVVIGTDNSATSFGNTVVVGKSNRSNTQSAVVIGYGQSSNSFSAVVLGKGNSSNSGQFTGSKTVIVGLNNSNNGKQNITHGSGPMVAVGINNTNNTSGFYFGQNNTGNNQMHVYGSDNNNLTNGDFGYVFGTGATVEKKVTSSSVMSGMQYGANNTTIDNGYVFGTSNTGRQGGYAFGAGNYAWLSGLAFGYDNAVTGDSNPVASTEFPMAFGRDNAVTNGGIVFGENNTASGTGLAIGANNTSTGSRSLAIGSGVTVSGTNSIGIGLNNTFSGNITSNNTFAVIGGRVGIGTVTPNSAYLMEIDGGHLNVKAPFDYYRHDVRLEDYIKNDVVNLNYITKQNADSDYVRSATTLGDHFQPTAFFRRNSSSQAIEYTGNKQVGIGKVPGNVVGFPNPTLDVAGGINFTTGLYLNGTRLVPSIDSISDVYISHQTLEYNIGPDSAVDFFDSAYVFARVSRQQPDGTRKAFGFGLFDSVQNVIDPTYINTRIDTSLFLDSSEALTLITEKIDENVPFRFNNTTGQVQLTSAEISNAGRPNLYGGVKVGIGIAPDTQQTLRVGGGTNAMEINGLLKLTGTAAKILIEKNGVLTEISDVQFKDDATTGNVRYDGGKNVGINLGIGTIASATLDVGGNINAATGLEIGGQDLLTGILTGTYLKGVLETVGDDGAYLDSAGVVSFVDSDYIRTIADSAYIKTALDSAHIKSVAYQDEEKLLFGQGGVFDHIQSFGTGDFEIKHVSGTGDNDSAQIKFFNGTTGTGKFLELKGGRVVLAHSNTGSERNALSTSDSGVTIDGKLNRHTIAGGTENFAFINPKIGDVSLVDSTYIRFHADSDYVRSATDSDYIRTAADSAYILTAADSAYVLSIADSAYILTAADSAYIRTATDSDYIKTAIDSAHVDLITGIGQRDVDFNQRSIFFKNSVANIAGLPSASQNEGSVFVTRDNYKANVATNGNFEKLAHHKHASDSDYILSVGRSTQLVAAIGATTINQIVHGSTFKSAEYLVSLEDSVLNHSQVSKLLMTFNGADAMLTNYGIVSTMTQDSQLGSFTIESDGTNLLLKLTKSSGTGTIRAKLQRTVL